ncbi:hydroxymethylglutaryl-coenzyme A synthase C terminal-domain-containing protein [Blyttiomyces helicus]|uniref:Hydroxymethylglutaryl-CoA synthase n=1 Tax=Blyttiomyces helicus TaxID=388810 RepID=A0A4V1IQM3_9FUNG|nr:hydroxymethylglutaryl-coenzyme A synthase C terminal-domain-containing protein [Blyttiomyces helicus]|eukprot:RKO87057.1 hydroxymethylglutaryl-coenzyme A synthase C terminal-domain-containing protein [Blyttiomyces helicus]
MLTGTQAHQRIVPENVGILGVQMYFPKKYVDQAELEKFDNIPAGKYTIGLGQTRMAICDDREDIHSICLTVVSQLLETYSVPTSRIGRLEVGTETIIDKAKSVKSVLMTLFPDNSDIEGIDTTNACYGGTNALLNAVNWVESSAWDGRLAIVVAGDIAVYKSGPARPTGGAGVVAMLVGPNAPLVFDRVRASHMEHVYDFYKPDLHSEYPEVDGPLTNVCYLKAVDTTYNRYLEKLTTIENVPTPTLATLDYLLFHSPYTKLVAKAYGRLAYNDFLRDPENPAYAAHAQFKSLKPEDTYGNRDVEKAFIEVTKESFAKKVAPALTASKSLGNGYTASLYFGLASLISAVESEQLQNKRIVLFSYGSGLASTMFSLTVRGPTTQIAEALNLNARLAARTQITPAAFQAIMELREKTHNVRDYDPVGPVDAENFFPGTFYLDRVDERFRRTYKRVPLA